MNMFNQTRKEDKIPNPFHPQEEEKATKEDTYQSKYECDNCGANNTLEIKKGVSISKHLQSKDCKYCGCKLAEGLK